MQHWKDAVSDDKMEYDNSDKSMFYGTCFRHFDIVLT